jgi:hypothetical protein
MDMLVNIPTLERGPVRQQTDKSLSVRGRYMDEDSRLLTKFILRPIVPSLIIGP